MRVKDAAKDALNLIRLGRYSAALKVLERAIARVSEYADWLDLSGVFKPLPTEIPKSDVGWGTVYAATLVGGRKVEELEQFSQAFLGKHPLPLTAPVLADSAWALLEHEQFAEAEKLLESAIPHLEGLRLGVAWRRLGQARFGLGKDWQNAFAKAREYLDGRLMGLALIAEAACWERSNDIHMARNLFTEALDFLGQDPYHLAWTRYSLGNLLLRELDLDAERHFLEAEKLTHKPQAKAFRPAVLIGLGTHYRSRGEWARAEAAYKKAARQATELELLREAHWRLGRCYRLQQDYGKARETLQCALKVFGKPESPVQVERAATLLASGDIEGARVALSKTGPLHGIHIWRAAIVQAEMARREGNTTEAISLLSEVPTNNLLAREEATAWPELFEMARQAGLSVPEPLEYVAKLKVRIQALGALQIYVNGQKIGIGPTFRIGELLVLLREKGGKVSSEHLIECLWPGHDPKQRRNALWQLVNELRQLLGWPASIQSMGKAYQLDPNAVWEYDVEEARKRGVVEGIFLDGIYSEWARGVDEHLEHLRQI